MSVLLQYRGCRSVYHSVPEVRVNQIVLMRWKGSTCPLKTIKSKYGIIIHSFFSFSKYYMMLGNKDQQRNSHDIDQFIIIK